MPSQSANIEYLHAKNIKKINISKNLKKSLKYVFGPISSI